MLSTRSAEQSDANSLNNDLVYESWLESPQLQWSSFQGTPNVPAPKTWRGIRNMLRSFLSQFIQILRPDSVITVYSSLVLGARYVAAG